MKTLPPNNGLSQGFTLVELLGAVAIAAILMALGLPALNRQLDKSRQAGCASNLRQIGVAMQAWTAENDGYLPPMDGNPSRWPDLLAPYVNSEYEYGNPAKQSKVFQCPAAKEDLSAADLQGYAVGYRGNQLSSSSEDESYVHWDGGYKMLKAARVPSPATFHILADRGPGGWRGWYGVDEINLISFRHDGRTNLLFLDGHVESSAKNGFKWTSQENWDGLGLVGPLPVYFGN